MLIDKYLLLEQFLVDHFDKNSSTMDTVNCRLYMLNNCILNLKLKFSIFFLMIIINYFDSSNSSLIFQMVDYKNIELNVDYSLKYQSILHKYSNSLYMKSMNSNFREQNHHQKDIQILCFLQFEYKLLWHIAFWIQKKINKIKKIGKKNLNFLPNRMHMLNLQLPG